MPWFQFLIRGENYLIDFGGENSIRGFYTTRNFKTATLAEAKELAYASIRNDKFLNKVIHENTQTKPMIYLEEIYELESKPKKKGRWPFRTRRGKGFIFFSDDKD